MPVIAAHSTHHLGGFEIPRLRPRRSFGTPATINPRHDENQSSATHGLLHSTRRILPSAPLQKSPVHEAASLVQCGRMHVLGKYSQCSRCLLTVSFMTTVEIRVSRGWKMFS